MNKTILKSWLIVSGLFLGITFSAYSQAELTFAMDNLDYGVLYTDSLPDGKVDIEFVNTGDSPLVLSNVTGCCGTRVNDWPKNPILPNETGLIKIEFKIAQRPHRLSRVVTVSSNSEKNPTARFRITGQIEERNQ